MPDIVPPATTTPAPGTSEPTVTWRESELARYRLEDLKAASRGSWSVETQIPAETRQRLANMAEIINRIDEDRA